MPPIILLTGATGLIGFRVLLAALSAGHTVRCTVRSLSKAQTIATNPAIQKLSPGSRLTFTTVPDICVDGAYDTAFKDITHAIHLGSPVPVPGRDPETEIYLPIVKSSSTLLASALKTPTLQRVIITSSFVSNLSPTDTTPVPTIPSTRIQLPPFERSKVLSNVFSAYHFGKIEAINAVDSLAREKAPHFSIAHVTPGYAFGRNELATNVTKVRTGNSSNNLLLLALTGTKLPAPLHGGYVHIDDVSEVHMRALFSQEPVKDTSITKSFGASSPVVFNDSYGYVEKAFPLAVKEGIFKEGGISTLPVEWDSSETAKELGIEWRSFESAVLDVAGQYLDLLGKERA